MLSLATFIARKYIQTKEKHHAIRFMMRISFLGIAIGTFALMLTLIIMNGFEKTIHEKMQGITSHAIITAPGNKIDDVSVKRFLQQKFPHFIEAMSSSNLRQVLLDRNKQQSILFLKGIEPEHESSVSSLRSKVIAPHKIYAEKEFASLFARDSLLIGQKMATTHKLSVGDTVTLMIPEPASTKKILLSKRKVKIGGIFKIGLDEYDNNFAYASLPLLRTLFDETRGVDQISLQFKTPDQATMSTQQRLGLLLKRIWPLGEDKHTSIIKELRAHLPGMQVQSWQELYPALVSSLKLEKYVMFFILALIVLVASMSMISVLFMQLQQKKRDIAIFKAMGMPYATVKRIFLMMGMGITLCATLFGLVAAASVGALLDAYPFIELPDVYYVTHLPVRMDFELFVIVFLCTLLLGFIATWIPIRKTRSIHITQVLRQE